MTKTTILVVTKSSINTDPTTEDVPYLLVQGIVLYIVWFKRRRKMRKLMNSVPTPSFHMTVKICCLLTVKGRVQKKNSGIFH